jgi:hypothetical protein
VRHALWVGILVGATAAHAQAPLTLEVLRSSVRLDLARGTRLGGSPGDTATLPSPLALRIARDEVVSFQLALRGTSTTTPIRVTAPPGLDVTVYAEHGVPVAKPSASTVYRSLGAGLYPDVLIPTATVTVPPAPGVAVLWIDVWAPREAAPGTVRGRIEVAGAPTVELSVEILPLTLPIVDVARLGAVSFGSLLERRARSPERFWQWMQLAHAHRLSIELMHVRPSTTAEGVDWARWAEDWGPLADGTAFTAARGYRGPRAGVPTPRMVVPLSDRFPSPQTAQLTPSDPAGWSRELARWEAEATRRGWLGRPESTQWIVFINSLDEPRSESQLRALIRFGELIDAAALADRRHVAMRVDGPFAQQVEGWSDARILEALGPAVDLWAVCGGTAWSPWNLLEARRVEAPTEGLMYYASSSSGEPATPPIVLDAELAHARAWGWLVREYELAGALNWEVDFRPGCAADPQCAGFGLNGDATLIYRGEDVGRATDEPLPSMRLKQLRRGAEDAALLAMLAERDADTARAVQDLMVPAAMGDNHPPEGPGAWPIEGLAYDRARDVVLDYLLGGSSHLSLAAVRPEVPSDPLTRGGGWPTVALVIGVLGAIVLAWRGLWSSRP